MSLDDDIDKLVDWQLSNPPMSEVWTCPDCGMNWTEQRTPCPCSRPEESGQPNASTLELCFWEAVLRCALDENVPINLSMCSDNDAGSGIELPNPIPPQLWQYMADAHAELRASAGVSSAGVSP